MSDIAIKFENISKQYRLGVVGTGTISHDLNRWWHTVRGKEDPYLMVGEANDRSVKGDSKYVWALRDISFDVKQGEVIGIIGKNGAGKSTLLKILSRVTSPTIGTIKAKGRIASLLEVGTGFHPELTGRENIYMNGSIMGMTKSEITSKLDEIVDFAGIERYIDTPAKRYSSGMTVRLGFAIAAHLEPEILVVDEVLAVGDAEFQKKAIGKMQDVSRGEGRTVLFVSHNMGSVRSLCNNGILLQNGSIDFSGNISDVIDRYLTYQENSGDKGIFYPDQALEDKFTFIKVYNSLGRETTEIISGDPISFKIGIQNSTFDKSIGIGIYFKNRYGERIGGITSFFGEINDSYSKMKDERIVHLQMPQIQLTPGTYTMELALAKKNLRRLDYHEEAMNITVIDGIPNVDSSIGYFFLNGRWTIE
ncbi:lipopolysaccharide transport system ATP-binding protein [Dysgonomonas sp. PFB1-18]|uniref:ABC transporter ATP-binding protein n=1 Tax=unclassified Dysgonomonas TaxID=2630389 RepID=UPI002474AC6A|nr:MULTISPECIES: ABC transporter ATP-binding protein [unclassified Dysgonomonas]MDH6309756.1 lipopolysaccharide transport system ATP-binding protein [Dysgonomonas sp. PF1-14]MDH6339236.1 lipopolysaccharide transport system ATP-binding protein [Dysgonomonas sp. PF1-16]MDH6380735.1 lipopolysaccharide transport system ATP-binding protein [Dysgonomonas sp. PFB1-18]MDH6398231.1 lipopolysaccharide transport system ATP-binding protein [Dysgonomonas sp. PF1-23]